MGPAILMRVWHVTCTYTVLHLQLLLFRCMRFKLYGDLYHSMGLGGLFVSCCFLLYVEHARGCEDPYPRAMLGKMYIQGVR
jgi:hypothetical protein